MKSLIKGYGREKRFGYTGLTDGGEVVSLGSLYPQEDSCYSFLLEAEWTPGPWRVLQSSALPVAGIAV
jgi:hypothetical protein